MFHPRGFFISLLLGNLLLVGLILGTGFLVIVNEVNDRTSLLTERFQDQLLVMVRNDLQESWPNVEEQIDKYCEHYFKDLGSRVTIVDALGRVLGDSESSSDKMEPHMTPDRPEIVAAMSGKHGEDTRLSKTTNIQYRYLAEPVLKDDEIVAVVRIATPVARILEDRRMLVHGVWISFVLMLLTATLLSLLLSWLWYKPIRFLNNEARRIADGDLEPSVPVDSPLEMAQLSQSLETMRRTVSRQLDTITRQRESLQTILLHLPDAIFAINRSAEVIYFNAAAKKLFRIESATERPFLQEIVRNAAIVEWYLECRRTAHLAGTPAWETTDGRRQTAADLTGTPVLTRKEIDLFGRKHVLELEFVETDSVIKEGVANEDAACLLIVSDLTEMVRACKMKTDFVANASHELRTPLAAIRVALDNVSDDVYDDRGMLEKIVQIVDRHASRLDALIEDLLALHGVEDETVAVRHDETNVAEQQSWIEELFWNRLDDRRLVLSIVSDFGDMSFRVDNKRLGLILQNLIDNAVKFTPEGGNISLNFRREESLLVIECRDTGFGIAIEEQQRVFERFYQGDSSKTGDGRLRGTGLGLAIVKHAVERLKGNISLESHVAQGSVFMVRIPVEFV
ncbi:MAG: ATP-binding protein [Planctomycetaceae bacterium]|nr:ATP-binding protein [Planctomycetaceae bacterium]